MRQYGQCGRRRWADRGNRITIIRADGTVLGEVTSGTFSPTLKQGIALALLGPTARAGDEVVVDVRGRDVPARVVKPPFVQVQAN